MTLRATGQPALLALDVLTLIVSSKLIAERDRLNKDATGPSSNSMLSSSLDTLQVGYVRRPDRR